MRNLSFGEAIKLLEEGKLLQRAGWNGKGMFIFKQLPSDVPASILETMTSLPDNVKAEFIKRRDTDNELGMYQQLRYRNQLAMVYPDNFIYGWLASPSDIFANDWQLYNSNN
jgi:hypothetical protein